MPNYFYTAKSFNGETKTGNLPAKDINQLSQSLKNDGLILIRAVSEEKIKKNKLGFLFPSFAVSPIKKVMLIKNLQVMVGAGLSMVKSLDILSMQFKNRKLRNALLGIKEKINKGNNFSDSLAEYPDIFSDLFLNMVKIGEESGTLDEVFETLCLQMEKEHELKSKMRNAMIYPSIVLLTMLGIGILIVTVVLPRLGEFFNSMNVEIPIYTRIILDFGFFAQKNWYFLLLIPPVLICSFLLAIKTKNGKWIKDALLLKIPLISSFVKKSNSALLIRSLSSLISSGVPLIKSLEIISKTVDNFYFKKALIGAIEKIKKGEKLSGALKTHQTLFPFGTIEMMEVGEETGKTSTILKKLAEFYEQEVVAAAENLSTAIEPVLILILGLAVGFFAVSIIGPMYSAMQSIV
ncbi:MAG: type II secretion system F family protein [Patescibacteria group bacterium]